LSEQTRQAVDDHLKAKRPGEFLVHRPSWGWPQHDHTPIRTPRFRMDRERRAGPAAVWPSDGF
jgi:hypothetical protein